ncbi:pinin/SDK/memA/ protein conserved region-domain-containing protein [Trichoderma sp. SZMC 28011]
MATMGESETVASKPADEDRPAPEKAPDVTSLKRKAEDESPEDDSPKRAKHNDDEDEDAVSASRRQPSPSHDHDHNHDQDHEDDDKEVPPAAPQDRRRQAMQEEKKRGKRLFGGLMSTLSQTSNTSQQQKRRLEIERRQQDRIQKQKAEDDQKRAEKLEKLHLVRMAEQIVFDEEVMKKKHEKRLAMAKFLRTRAEPSIFYLPWKTTPEQKDIIDDQIQRAKATVEKEVEQFEARKQRHIERYGPPTRQISVTPDESAATRAPERESPIRSPHHSADKTHLQERRVSQDLHRGHHDESGDDLEEAEEDMVIY